MKKILITIAALAITQLSFSQDIDHMTVFTTYSGVALNEETSAENQHGTEGKNIEFSVSGSSVKYATFGAGYNMIWAKDLASFTNNIYDLTGSDETATSSISIYGFYVEGGPAYNYNNYVQLSLPVGLSLYTADRSVADCYGCDRESLDAKGGLYMKPTAHFWLFKSKPDASDLVLTGGITVKYKQNISNQFIDSGLQIGINFAAVQL